MGDTAEHDGPDTPPRPEAEGWREGARDQAREQARDAGKERSGVSGTVWKALSSGYRAVASSEDGIKSVLSDAIPKELVTYMMRQTDAAKDEVVRIIGQQIRRFLENLDLAGEIQKILTAVSFEIRTEIRFVPNDSAVKPRARASVRLKATGEDDDDAVTPQQRKARMAAVRDVVASALSRMARDAPFDVEVRVDDPELSEEAEGAGGPEGPARDSG